MAAGRQVEAVWTTATPVEALRALSDAHEVMLGERPTMARLLVLAGQSALETGPWQRMKNFSVGGVKGSPAGPRDYAVYPTTEVLNGKKVTLHQPFRAFPTLAAGFADWLEFLRQDRFEAALRMADAFDPVGYADELKRQRYYTSDAASYGRGVKSLAEEFGHLPLDWSALCKAGSYEDDAVARLGERAGGGGNG